MTVRFQCACGKKLKAADDMIGKKILCSDCGKPVTIPAHNTAAAEHVLAEDMEDEPTPPKSSKSAVTKKPKSEVTKDAVSNYAAELMRGHEAETRRRNSVNASASATNLMGQKAASPAKAPAAEKAPIDWAGTFRQFGPWTLGTVALCVGAWFLGELMFGYKPTLPELAPVSGFVMLDGKPLADVEITFVPVIDHRAEPDPNKVPPADSVARTDGTGKYVLTYSGDQQGAAVGPHKVTLRSTNFDKGVKQVPPVYGSTETSPLIVEVKPEGDDKMNFDLSSAAK